MTNVGYYFFQVEDLQWTNLHFQSFKKIAMLHRVMTSVRHCSCCVCGLWKLHQGIESMGQSGSHVPSQSRWRTRRTNSRRCGSRLKYVNAKHRRDFGWHEFSWTSHSGRMFLHKMIFCYDTIITCIVEGILYCKLYLVVLYYFRLCSYHNLCQSSLL